MSQLRDSVTLYSAKVGANRSLIQGAGGNISWKENGEIWIKASGTWLERSIEQNIFVGLNHAQALDISLSSRGDYSPAVLANQILRPSIETALHALLPQRVVFHCHPIDIIARSVSRNSRIDFEKLFAGLNWLWLDYHKPGVELANSLNEALLKQDVPPNIIVLANHGLVLAGESIAQIDQLLADVLEKTTFNLSERLVSKVNPEISAAWNIVGYRPSEKHPIQQIATDPKMLDIARNHWVLYPDHAVFLGESAFIAENTDPSILVSDHMDRRPPCIIFPGVDVMISNTATVSQTLMIECYAEVLRRLGGSKEIVGLSSDQVSVLLNWDAEKHRRTLNS